LIVSSPLAKRSRPYGTNVIVVPLKLGWKTIDFSPEVPLDAFSASRNDMPSGPGLLIKAVILEVSPFTTSEELVTVTVTMVVRRQLSTPSVNIGNAGTDVAVGVGGMGVGVRVAGAGMEVGAVGVG
jgi:hypothetical protein